VHADQGQIIHLMQRPDLIVHAPAESLDHIIGRGKSGEPLELRPVSGRGKAALVGILRFGVGERLFEPVGVKQQAVTDQQFGLDLLVVFVFKYSERTTAWAGGGRPRPGAWFGCGSLSAHSTRWRSGCSAPDALSSRC
jgi:hypothetical protein